MNKHLNYLRMKDRLQTEAEQIEDKARQYERQNEVIEKDIQNLKQMLFQERSKAGRIVPQKMVSIVDEFAAKTKQLETEIDVLDRQKQSLLNQILQDSDVQSTRILSSFVSSNQLKQSLQLEEDKFTKEKAFYELKDAVEANHSKISMQVRRAKQDLEQKLKVDIEFLNRRIEERRNNNSELDKTILKLKEDVYLQELAVKEAYERQAIAKQIVQTPGKTSNHLGLKDRQEEFYVFVDFLSDKFVQLKDELELLWNNSGRGHNQKVQTKQLRLFLEGLSEIKKSLQEYKL